MLVTSCAGQETDRYACGSTSGLTTPSQMGELTHLDLGMCKIIPKTWASCPDDIIMNHYQYIQYNYVCLVPRSGIMDGRHYLDRAGDKVIQMNTRY